MDKTKLFLKKFLTSIIFITFGFATTLHVATTGSDETGDGSVDNPFATIQHGIDATSDGDTVLVAAGTYGKINYNSKNIAIIGEDRETTIIDGNHNGSAVTAANGETYTGSYLSGFTITGGNNNVGGGVNVGYNEGGITIENCIIRNNSGHYGAALGGEGLNDCRISNTIIKNNNGVAPLVYAIGGVFNRCLIIYNTADAILHNEGNGVTSYVNCTIAYNSTNYSLISNRNSSSYTNLIVYGNSSNEIFETDPTTATYSFIQGGASGMGNIDGDPLIFPNLFLMEGSPCIDTGNPDLDGDGITWENDPDDQDSDGSRMDMGVFEYDPSVSVPDEFSIYLYDSESYINAGNDASLNLTNNFTIEAWFKLEQWGSETSDTYNYIVSKVSDSWDSGFTLITNGLGEFFPQKSIVLTLSGPNNTVEYWHTDANTVSLNTWTHVAVTYSSGEITIFINGEEQVINLYDGYTEITTAEIPDHSSIPLYIGNRYDLNRLFAGLIDEVRIWDEVRTTTEINQHLFTNLSGSEDNLVGYWNFNEGTGTTAEDVSLNTNDGIIMGAVHSTDIHDEIISQFTTDSNIQWPSSGGIQFTDKSIAKEGVNIISWVWNFGDGTTSTQQNPLHIYQEDGVYTVSLTVTADNGSSNTYLATGLITVYSIATITSPTLGQEFSVYGDINFSWTSHFNFYVLNWILDWYKSDSLLHSHNINMDWHFVNDVHPYYNWEFFSIPEESPTGDDYKCRLNVIVEGDTGWVESDYFTINSPIPTAAELIYPTSVDTFSTHVDNNVPILFTWHPSEDANDDDILYKLIIQLEYFGNSYTEVHENISDTTISIMSNALDLLMNAILPDESILNWYVESFDGYYTVISDPNQFFLIQSILSTDDNQLYPKTFALHQNYPNPFNPITTFRYDLPEDAIVNITIYDMMGRIVKNLVSSQQNAGYKSIQWNATNNMGQPVSAGLYLYTIQAGKFRQTKKMVLLK